MPANRRLRQFVIALMLFHILSCSAFSHPPQSSKTESTTAIEKLPETRSEFLEWREQIWNSIVSEIKDDKDDSLLLVAGRAALWSGCDSCGKRLVETYGNDPGFRREIFFTKWEPKTALLTPEDDIYEDQLVHKRIALNFAARPNALGFTRILDILLPRHMQYDEFLAEEAARHCNFSQFIELGDQSECSSGLAVLSHCGNDEATKRIISSISDRLCTSSNLLALVDSIDLREAACTVPNTLKLLAEFYPDEVRTCALSRLSENHPLTDISSLEALGYVDSPPNELVSRIVSTLKRRPDRWECLIAPAAIAGENVEKEMRALRRLPFINGCMAYSLVSLARSNERKHWDLLLEMSQIQTSLLAKYAFDAIAIAGRDEQLLADAVKSSFTSKNRSGLVHIRIDYAESIYLRFVQTAKSDLVTETFKIYMNDDDATKQLQVRALLALSILSEESGVAEIMKDATKSPWEEARITGLISLWAHYEKKL